MADPIYLTDGNDVYVYDSYDWTDIRGKAGDDKITIRKNGNVLGGPGNDTIVNESGRWIASMYWDSPAAIYADLEAGYVLDGYGTRDTLVNITNIHTSGHSGDTVFGSSRADNIAVNGFDWSKGTAFVDGRGGIDTVNISGNISDYKIVVSSDGRNIVLSKKNYVADLKNIENISVWNHELQRSYEFSVTSLIDFSKVGQETLVASNAHSWNSGTLGRGVTLTYSFMSAAPAYGGAEGGTGFQAPSADYISAVRQILTKLQTETGIQFQEVTDSATNYGQLRFGANQQTATKGYAYIPGTVNDARAGDVWLDIETLSVLKPGQEGWQVLLHEIGHALGLSHPVPEADASGKIVLLNGWNWNGYTVMSENLGGSRLYQEWFGELDLQALRYFYGASSSVVGQGNTTYKLTDTHGRSIFTISDSEGWDTLDLSSLTYGATIDLRLGAMSSVGVTSKGSLSWNNLLFSSGTVIEEIIGTAYDDVLIGSAGDQVFHVRGGNDSVEGGAGTDIVVVSGLLKDYTVYLSDYTGHWQVEHRPGELGSVDLTDIQVLRFNDLRVALNDSSASVLLSGTKAGYSFRVAQNGEVTVIGTDRGVIKDLDQVTFSDGQAVRLMNLLPKAYLSGAGPYDAKVQAYFVTTLGRGATPEELKNFSSILASQQGSVWKDANGQTGNSGSLVGALFAMAEFQPFVEAAKDSQNYGQIVRDMYGRMTGGLVPDDDILDYYVNQLSSSIKLRGLANAILNDLSLMPRADGILSQPNTWKVNMFDQMTPSDYMGFLTQLELVGIDVTNLDATGTLTEIKTPSSI